MGKLYTSTEVAAHNSRKSCWIVIRDNVYDVTTYLDTHPGGEDPLLDSAGMDATAAFEEAGHSSYAKKQLNKFKIGSLAPGERCGPPTCVYRCEYDEKRRRNNVMSSNRSTPNRSQTPSLQKCYSKEAVNKCCSKSLSSLRRSKSKTSLRKSGSKSTVGSKRSNSMPPIPNQKSKSEIVPVPIPRVQSIVVPPSRKPSRPPPESSKLKYALLALAIAIVAGVAYKKYAS